MTEPELLPTHPGPYAYRLYDEVDGTWIVFSTDPKILIHEDGEFLGPMEKETARYMALHMNVAHTEAWNRRASPPRGVDREKLLEFFLKRKPELGGALKNFAGEIESEIRNGTFDLPAASRDDRDFTPEEALAEARKRWGNLAIISSHGGPGGHIYTVAAKAMASGPAKGKIGSGITFKYGRRRGGGWP